LGILTFGVAPNAPVAVTDEFVADDPADDDDAEEEADAEEEDFDEPQPARTAQASRGIAMSARKRRMKNPQWWWMSGSPAYWRCRATTPSLQVSPANSHPRDELFYSLVY
jgi:hypothetical protein